jgi:porin
VTRRRVAVAAMTLAIGAVIGRAAAAEDAPAAPPYTGGTIFDSSTFTGDWRGSRNYLAAKGITFDANVTQVEQSVVGGGKNDAWEYGGRGDLTGNLDTQKLGLWPGGFLTVELEGNWAKSVNNNVGSLLPANTNQLFPIPGGGNVALPNLSFMQFVSHYVGGLIGKVQTITDGDLNEFAHGKGATQFMNLAFNANPTVLLFPYSTLAAGAIILPTADLNQAIVKFLVLSATGKASTSGFDNFDGAIFASEGRVRTGFFDLTGHQLLGAAFSNKTYTSLDQRLGSIIGNQPLTKKNDTWSMWYNFDQYLYEPKPGVSQGIGVFGRFGASAGDPVPAQYFLSAGIGGKGLLDRPNDQFGLGYYYTFVSNPTLVHPNPRFTRSFLRDEWGFEAYYDVALLPWLLLTPDLQVIGPSQRQQVVDRHLEYIGTATIFGVRLQVLL